MRSSLAAWPLRAAVILLLGTLAACGGGGSGDAPPTSNLTQPSTSPPQTAPSPGRTNNAPSITGSPATTAAVGQAYVFQPQASDADGDRVTFTIANKPAWMAFDATTGRIAGTPAASDVGTYANIEIAATDGKAVTALPAFTLRVNTSGTSGANGSVSIAWEPPTQNDDGTALTDLRGYQIHVGPASQTYVRTIPIDNPTVTRFVIDNLASGTWFIAITAMNVAGVESGFSPEVSTRVN
jgi:predicted small lipoprotein YifL